MILIFPWSRMLLPGGKPSPKNYPYWPEVVSALKSRWECIQVSSSREPGIGCAARIDDAKLPRIAKMLEDCSTWLSVDSFVPHMAWTLKQPGVVIFGPSDPKIFGHPENINLLKDPRYLRRWQFRHWSQVAPDPEAFLRPETVVASAILSISKREALKKQRQASATG